MFLRAKRGKKDGKDHLYWSLVETVRTADGLRQRTVCYLGELNTSAAARWRKTIQIFNAQGEEVQLALFPADGAELPEDARIVRIRLDRVRWTRPREFGDVWLGWHLWQRLGLQPFCERALDAVPADVPWSRIAALLAINRLCAPGSELAIEARWYGSTAPDDLLGVDDARGNTDRPHPCLDLPLPPKAPPPPGSDLASEARWYGSTALDDLVGVDDARVNTDRLYRCLDLLLPQKAALQQHLTARYGELFRAQYEVLLYDLTSTYVEG